MAYKTPLFFGYGNGHAHRSKSNHNEDHGSVEFGRRNHLTGMKGCAVVKAPVIEVGRQLA